MSDQIAPLKAELQKDNPQVTLASDLLVSTMAVGRPRSTNEKIKDTLDIFSNFPSVFDKSVQHIKEHSATVGEQFVAAAAIGAGLTCMARNPSLVGKFLSNNILNTAEKAAPLMIGLMTADVGLRLGSPMVQLWNDGDKKAAQEQLAANIGSGLVDYGAGTLGGLLGASAAFKYTPRAMEAAFKVSKVQTDNMLLRGKFSHINELSGPAGLSRSEIEIWRKGFELNGESPYFSGKPEPVPSRSDLPLDKRLGFEGADRLLRFQVGDRIMPVRDDLLAAKYPGGVSSGNLEFNNLGKTLTVLKTDNSTTILRGQYPQVPESARQGRLYPDIYEVNTRAITERNFFKAERFNVEPGDMLAFPKTDHMPLNWTGDEGRFDPALKALQGRSWQVVEATANGAIVKNGIREVAIPNDIISTPYSYKMPEWEARLPQDLLVSRTGIHSGISASVGIIAADNLNNFARKK